MNLKPIVPFEPVRKEEIPAGPRWRHEVKWDGTRVLVYHENGQTRLFNRKLRERTAHYPELLDIGSYCRAKSVILDGEVIALAEDGKPSFHEVMKRDQIKRLSRIGEMRRAVPITYMVFDIVYADGRWMHDVPLAERLGALERLVEPTPQVQRVSGHPDGKALFAAVGRQGMEGIVCKDLHSVYAIGKKDDRWVKVKCYGDTIAVIGGYTLNGPTVNAVLLGQYDSAGRLWYIGHAGTGRLTREEWRELTEVLRPLTVARTPFVNLPARIQGAFWVRPELTVKVQYSEWRWQEGRSLRHPSIQAIVNVPPEECRLP